MKDASMPADHHHYPSDVAFTPAVKAIQERKGSRASYARMERSRGWETTVTEQLAEFLATLDMFYLGTANAEGPVWADCLNGATVSVGRLQGGQALRPQACVSLGEADGGGHRDGGP